MALTIEGDPAALSNKWPWLVDTDSIRTSSLAYGANATTAARPDFLSLDGRRGDMQSNFRNGVVFVRVTWPLGVYAMLRWGNQNASPAFLQLGLGWKVNGRIGATLRLQSDASAAAGVKGPNLGQAVGFAAGPH